MDQCKPFDSNERPGISPAELALLNAILAEHDMTPEARSAINRNFYRGIAPADLRARVTVALYPIFLKPEAATVMSPIVKTGTSGAGKSQASSRSKTRGKKG